jgi:hypothetical protein
MEKEEKKKGLKSIAGFYQTRTCSSQLTISQQLKPRGMVLIRSFWLAISYQEPSDPFSREGTAGS